jgi:sialic acid synthase SpsE
MRRRPDFDRVFIISEIHPQHSGDLADAYSMILQSKMAGADAVKVQLYDTERLHGNRLREYLQLSKDQLRDLKAYADSVRIDLFASVFDTERLEWCEELDFKYHKIASRSVKEKFLCRAVISTGKPVFMSLGMFDWRKEGLPYESDNIIYFYCVAKYPALLEEIEMPFFTPEGIFGYSDHTIGIAACVFAISRGAQYIEKHFTLNKSRQYSTEKAHVCSMDFDELRLLRQLADGISLMRPPSQ